MSELLERLDGLSPERQALLREILRQKAARAAGPDAIRPRGEAGPAPLSFAQRRLWLMDRLEPGSPAYNMPYALRLGGPLDGAALERALGEIVRRHETLRTVFAEEGGEPVQVVTLPAFRLPVEDLSALDADAREAAVRRRHADEAARPFDLAAGPLFRAGLLRLGAEDHVLFLTLHHVVSDGWSTGVLFHELAALYEAYETGAPSPLPELPIQYADFAAWQRDRLRGEALEARLAWWRDRLAGAPALLELPADRPRPAARTSRGATVPVALDGGVAEALRELGRGEDATLYMVLLAAFQALLAKYAGTDDVVVGSPVAGRARRETEGLIGFFVDTLVLRTDLSGDPSFREVVRRVREGTLGAYEHQDLPFDALVEALQPERSLGHAPLFQVLFALQNADGPPPALAGLRTERLEAPWETTKFDLSLGLAPDGGDVRGVLTYSTDLFEGPTIERMRGHLVRLVEQVSADADVPLSRIDLLDEAERRLVLAAWNATDAPYPAHASIHALFAEQAARTPDATAVVSGDESLTYGALDARANRLARALRRRGVGPETRVGVCLERGPDLVVSLLAILKAGGAYVPLDPAYPAERLAFMRADAGVPVLLTDSALRDRLPAAPGVHVVCLDADAGAIGREDAAALDDGVGSRGLAYVLYTSGSTGTPKGVAVEHRSVVRLVRGTDYAHFGPGETWLQAAPVSFDASTLETWGALLNGGRLVMVPGANPSLEELGRIIRGHGVTSLWLTAGLFGAMAQERLDDLRGVRQLLSGGDVLPVDAVAAVRRHLPHVRLINGYGPTENTTFTTCHTIGDGWSGGPVPIGTPVHNTRVYVLDDAMRPVPIGLPGELYAGGDGVARGYVARPALTAARFVPDPYGAPGSRLYRTGDRARWRPDGTLEFLGRRDAQVKIRGFRVEPGEIESALRGCGGGGVRDCAVVVRGDGAGDRRIVAYVVGDADGDVLRAHLRGRLPEYMLPAAFVSLDALPLTANGKLDRGALPAPDFAAEGEAYAAPRTPAEELLAGIWAEVLGTERIGIHDNFFDRGGHSLLATRVVSRVRDVFGVELPLRALFEHATVAGLAGEVEARRRAQAPPLPPVVPVDRGGALPLSFAQERLWFLDRMEPDSPFYNVPAALRLSGPLRVDALERALGEVVRRHEALRTVFAEVDGVAAQRIVPFTGFALAVEDLSALAEDAREAAVHRRAAEDAGRPFDLGRGPLFRASLLRLGDGDHVLLICIHHVVSDGWSLGVLFRELSALYEAYETGADAALPPLPVQYADVAAWQRAHLRDARLEALLAYWRGRLAGAPALLELPTDRPRPAAQTYRGDRVPVAVPPGLLAPLRALARAEGATPYMVLLAAFQLLLAKYAGTDDVVVGSPVAGRTRAETEGLIGFFVNSLVLRTELAGAADFRDVLRRVRETTLGAYEHQALPFEKLVAELQPERSLGHAPLFQVLFTLQNADMAGPALPGVRTERVESAFETTKFDLSLGLMPDGGGLRGALAFATDLFDRATALRMAEHFVRVLAQVAADPGVRLPDITLLDDEERRRVVETWNATDAAYPAESSIHGRFEAQAARTPDAIALVAEAESLTYAALDARANRLAHHLRRRGVGPEARVGLCLERGVEMVVALLGVLKAGAAYVPLDPGYPAERLAHMLADAGVALVLAQSRLRGVLPSAPGVAVVDVDALGDALAAEPASPPGIDVDPRNLAYVIYTSGSTGRPKGVMNAHGPVVNRLCWMQAAFGLGPDDAVLQKTPFSFDVSVWEFFWPLMTGARLVMARPDGHRDPLYLRDAIRAHGVTTVHFVPSMLQPFVEAADGDGCASLRRVICSGEALPPALVADFHARFPSSVELHNLYGPTEAAVDVSHWPCERDASAATVPIGRPVWNTRLYVLDEGMRPVPAGVPGELYIGGVQVARGYLHRPGLTAERFVPDPFAPVPGARLYRTGDRARWKEPVRECESANVREWDEHEDDDSRADASTFALSHARTFALEYLGRLDAQVKIRGFRIELGEIEAVLRSHGGVRACAVVVREDAPGDRRLVAYVAGDADGDTLRAHLRRILPEHMVPAAFVILPDLPLTPSGKLDRRALPAPDFAAPDARHVAPRTEAEAALAATWAEVLRVGRVGVHDGFFALGGDSILSVQVVSRARRAGWEITPRQMFEHQTVAELAAVARPVADAARPLAARAEGAARLTPIQARFFALGHPAPAHYNQSLLLEVDASIPGGVLERALAAVLAHHDVFRLRFRRTDAGWAQRHGDDAGIALEHVDLSALPPEAQDGAQEEAAQARQASLGLEDGPLGRAVLFDRGGGRRVLLLVLHHLVVDGVSWRILREDLERACAQLRAGAPVDLGPMGTSFAAWGEALAAFAASPARADEAAYWRAQSAERVAALPVDGDGAGTMGGLRTVSVRLDADETRALLQEVPAAYRTQVNDVLLCALAEAVAGWTGHPRVRVALEGHGREGHVAEGIDLTRTVGWFTSLYPVVLDLAGAEGPGDRLRRVKEQLRAVPGRGIGHGVLRWMAPDADLRAALAAAPEPEISFNYLGQLDGGTGADPAIRPADGPRGRDWAYANRHPFLLDVNGAVRGGCLRLGWAYHEGVHRRETVERVAADFLAALRGLIAHCRAVGPGGCTPSDFPLAALTQAQLDAVVAGRRVEDLYPLSPLQEGLLFHALYGGEAQAYQVQAVYRLDGTLDGERFRRAWAEVVARHAILRTSFAWEGLAAPLQRVEFAAEVPWTLEDWRGRSAAEQEAALDRFLEADRARGFALDRAPLLRCALLRLGDDAHWFAWSQHHLLSDGWAASRVLDEVLGLYGAWGTGAAPRRAPVRPYRDFIAWLRARDDGAAERYWRGVLAGFAAPTPLPADHPATPGAPVRHARASAVLSAARTRRLGEFARGAGVTLNTVLLGAWGLLLSRLAGEDDVVFGTTVAGRPASLEGVEEMIGLFINTLPVRMRVPGGARVGAWLDGVQRAQAEAREHEFSALAQVQGWSEVPRGTPLFETHFIFENYPVERGGRAGADAARLRVSGLRAVEWNTYPLSLMAVPGPELRLRLSYDAGRFHASTIGRMLAQLGRLIEQLAEDADRPLSALSLMDADERRLVVDEWNRTDRPYPRDVCLHERFEAQARIHPSATALEWGGVRLSYAELDARTNRLAHHLRRLGAGPEARVGVLMERGMDLVVSILGILKAGGCYVPLDPTYPPERLRLMVADAGIPVVLAHAVFAALVAESAQTVAVDEAADAIAAESAEPVASGATAENLAYIVYTSGSTGRPKGVMVNHRTVVQLVVETDYVRFGPGDRIAQASNASFDALAFETWGALLNGATLVGIDRDVLLSPSALRAFLREERITTLYQTTALLNQLSREHADIFQPLREVLFGGQVADPEAVRRVVRGGKPARLLHMYGPTETTAWCSYADLQHVADDARTVSVGGPTGNQRIYLLDSALHPVPVGVPGEAYVGGGGVVRGYLDRPALTAERFVPDPFATEPGARMYRTGDRLRWKEQARACESAKVRESHDDGSREDASTFALSHARTFALEFLGRLDAQVKIRGFRIEPGEIEAALSAHPDVREARVIVREDAPGEPRLAAYVVAAADGDDLRAFLRRGLPEYMVPAAVVRLDRIPLTPNGKLDVRALPAPDLASDADHYVAPRTPVEAALAAAWAEVLGVDRVGATDDFFALGGHSLRVIRVVSRIREALGVELPLRAVFETPTVAGLAAAVAALRGGEADGAPALVPVPRGAPLPLSFAQERLWFLDRLRPGSPSYNVAAAVRLRGPLDAGALERALGEVVRRHEALRTTFAERDGTPVQVIHPFRGFALPVEDQTEGDDAERAERARRRAAEEAARPFDLGAGPLFRAALLRLGDDDHGLLLTLHHVVSDGWSVGVLYAELSALYGAFAEGRPSPLAPLPVQYPDFAAWQRAHLRGDAFEAQLAYWTTRLAGAPALLELPTDRPRPAEQDFHGAGETFHVPAALAERLRALGQAEGATPFMVLLAAWKVLLARYAGADDVVVGTAIAGRTRGETEGLIGFFVNTLALRTDLSGDPDVRALLARVRETALGAYAHQEVPFERLVGALRPERSLSHAPLVQVTFSLTQGETGELRLPGVRAEGLGAGEETTRFDLSLSLATRPDGLRGLLSYATALWDAGTMRRMTGHLLRILHQFADDPGRPLSRLRLLDDGERGALLAWGTTAPAPAEPPVHARFAAQAARTPDGEALRFGGRTTTYRELDEASARLAHHLRARGVGPESRVGIFAARAPETVVAILAVLRAGGAYVPLDPAYPAERLRYMLADCGARTAIAPAGVPEGIPPGLVPDLLDPRAEADAIAARPAHAPPVALAPESAAYVIYTSGSTGQPKGVVIPHRGAANLARAEIERFGMGPGTRVLQFASFSFDATVWEMFATLASGGALVLASREDLLPGPPLLDVLRTERVSLVLLPPSVLAMLPPEDLPALRTVVTGGEAADAAVVARWGTGRTLVNAYGPTEITVAATWGACAPDGRAPSIGRPVDGLSVRVLDGAGEPSPVGVPGELFAGGAGVARGYLGRPGLTAARFVPDPFADAPGARMYRTGDRARWRPDGTLEFLGRVDAQVKVRGFRIEPGEVEAALRRAGAAECAVVVRGEASTDRRLVAYVAGGVSVDALRARLRERLPEYLVPGAFVVLDHLPVTPNGKVDRAALPAPRGTGGASSPPPRSAMEARVSEAWREVLDVPAVGIHDNFFDLGGTSLLLYRVYSRLREVRADLRVVDLFRYTTVEELGRYLDADAAPPPDGDDLARSRSRGEARRAARRRG